MDLEAPEAGEATGVGDNMLDGATDARGDGLLVDKGDGGTGLEEALLLVLGSGLVGWGDGDSGVWSLDHAEGSDDFLERVRQLQAHVSIAF